MPYLYRETGTIKPKPHGGGAMAIIKKSELKQIEELVNEQPDALLREYMRRTMRLCANAGKSQRE